MLKLQKTIEKYLKERNWLRLKPADLAKSVVIEAAELLEHFQWSHPETKDLKKDKAKMEEIQSEVADIFIYLADMAVILGFDLEKAVETKLKKIDEKYPAKLFKKHIPGSAIYWKTKEEHRKNKVLSK